jgi:TonB family protein
MGVSSAVVMTFMSMSKLQLGILGAVAVTGTTGFMLQSQANSALTRELAALRQETRTATTAEVVRSTGKNEAGFDEQKARAYDAELRRLAAETAEVQKLNAANHAKMRAEAAVQTVKTPALSVAQLDRFPQVKARSAPTYPDELRQAGITGEVLVEFVVDGNGAVQGAFPVSSTHPDFEAAAVAAVEKWKFDAGLKGGRPVNTRLRQAITFSLAEATVPSSTWF